jgi:membrane protease YdiL (CAAX protease family)
MLTEAGRTPDRSSAVSGGRGEGWRMDEHFGRKFIDLAGLGINTRRAYIITVLRIVVYYLGFTGIVLGWVLLQRKPYISAFEVVIVAYGAIIAAGVAVVQGVARSHRRPWRSVVSAELTLDWRRLAIGAGVQTVLSLALACVANWIADEPWGFACHAPISVIALAAILTPLQAASEELLFRGYLTQALGRILGSRTAIVVLVGLVFAALHLNVNGPLTAPYMFAVSVTLSLVSLRDRRLELGIGAHTAVNWLSLCAIDSLVYDVPEIVITWPFLLASIVKGALFYVVTGYLVQLMDRRAGKMPTSA